MFLLGHCFCSLKHPFLLYFLCLLEQLLPPPCRKQLPQGGQQHHSDHGTWYFGFPGCPTGAGAKGAANEIMDDLFMFCSKCHDWNVTFQFMDHHTEQYITHDDFRVPYLSGVCSWRFLMLLIHFGRYRWMRWVTKSWKLSNIFDQHTVRFEPDLKRSQTLRIEIYLSFE